MKSILNKLGINYSKRDRPLKYSDEQIIKYVIDGINNHIFSFKRI